MPPWIWGIDLSRAADLSESTPSGTWYPVWGGESTTCPVCKFTGSFPYFHAVDTSVGFRWFSKYSSSHPTIFPVDSSTQTPVYTCSQKMASSSWGTWKFDRIVSSSAENLVQRLHWGFSLATDRTELGLALGSTSVQSTKQRWGIAGSDGHQCPVTGYLLIIAVSNSIIHMARGFFFFFFCSHQKYLCMSGVHPFSFFLCHVLCALLDSSFNAITLKALSYLLIF